MSKDFSKKQKVWEEQLRFGHWGHWLNLASYREQILADDIDLLDAYGNEIKDIYISFGPRFGNREQPVLVLETSGGEHYVRIASDLASCMSQGGKLVLTFKSSNQQTLYLTKA